MKPGSQLPTPLARSLDAWQAEPEPFRAVHRLIDAIEVTLKLHTVAAVSQFQRDACLSDGVRMMLAAGLKTPSLGIWWQFAREATRALVEMKNPLLMPEMERFLGKRGALFKALEGKNNLIAFRNRYAHGATPPNEQCQADLERYGPRLLKVIEASIQWQKTRLIAVLEDGSALEAVGPDVSECAPPDDAVSGHCYLVREGDAALDLHPLLVYRLAVRGDSGGFFFYNDLRSQTATVLNYVFSAHHRDASIRDDLLERYPISEWGRRRVDMDEFRERIEALTEVFKGRREELRRVVGLLGETDRGALTLWGGPGVGKSALLARAIQILRWSEETRKAVYPDMEVSDLDLHVVEYFIRRGSTDRADSMLDSINKRLEIHFKTNVPIGNNNRDRRDGLRERLRAISAGLSSNERLILFVDGLDEGTGDPVLLASLPREAPERVHFVYSSRPQPQIRNGVYLQLDREVRNELSIEGLKEADTRALLYEHVDKYALKTSYVRRVTERSQGNPLYLKLLCQGLEQGDYRINDSKGLPQGMEELYEKVLVRLGEEEGAEDLLCLMTAARDYLSPSIVALMLGMDRGAAERGPIAACMEVLLENELTENYDDYQLFHESLREYLKQHRPIQVVRWQEALADWSLSWGSKGDPVHARVEGVRRYAAQHAVSHLHECWLHAREERSQRKAALRARQILSLVDDRNWREMVYQTCGNAGPLQRALVLAQQVLCEEEDPASVLTKMIDYSILLHEEGYRLYQSQQGEIARRGSHGSRADLEELCELAEIGASPKDKVMLVAMGLWEASSVQRLPQALQNKVRQWLEDAQDPVLEQFWQETCERGQGSEARKASQLS